MRIMSALIALGAALSLSACTTLGTVEQTIQDKLPQTCALIESAHVAFVIVAATGNVPASVIRKENAAYQGVTIFCEDPSRVTASNALVLVAGAYATIVVALRDAGATP